MPNPITRPTATPPAGPDRGARTPPAPGPVVPGGRGGGDGRTPERDARARRFIRELEGNVYLEGVFAIQNCQLGQTKNGKPFIKCLLADRSGRAPGRMWNASEDLFAALPTDGFVFIQGNSQPYQGEMQIVIQHIENAKPTDAELVDLMPCSEYDPDTMFAELTAIMASLDNPCVKALAQRYLDDAELMTRFRRAPAAMQLHHAFISGLLEHTLSLLRLGELVCSLYPRLNRDIVLMGLFVHDLGKCCELSWDSGFGYTDDGQLVGHIGRGVIWLQAKAEACRADGCPVPEPILMVLHHIILSHHGKAEFGALKLPSTPEAIAVSLLDNTDARLHMALAAARGDAKPADLGGNFTEKIWALETRLYRPDPTTMD